MKLTRKEADRLGAIWGAAHKLFGLLEDMRPGGGFGTCVADNADAGGPSAGPSASVHFVPEGACSCAACQHAYKVVSANLDTSVGRTKFRDALSYLLERACEMNPPRRPSPHIADTAAYNTAAHSDHDMPDSIAGENAAVEVIARNVGVPGYYGVELRTVKILLRVINRQRAQLAHSDGLLADAREVLGRIMTFCWPAPQHHWRGFANMKGLLEIVHPVIGVLRRITDKADASAAELVEHLNAAAPVTREEIAQVIYGNVPEYKGGPPLSPDDYAAAERVLKYFTVERKVL